MKKGVNFTELFVCEPLKQNKVELFPFIVRAIWNNHSGITHGRLADPKELVFDGATTYFDGVPGCMKESSKNNTY